MAASEEVIELLCRKGYIFCGRIATGGTSSIYLIKSLKFNDNFILKQIELKKLISCKRCELEALRGLNSNMVIRLYDFEVAEDYIYLILEYCPMGSLEKIVKDDGPFERHKLLGIYKLILEALRFIHSRKFAHSDIKPANILVDRYGRSKFADFGFSMKFRTDEISTQRAGSLNYLPPEIITQNQFDPFSADIWSTGITFYYLATGTVPWPSTQTEIIPAIVKGDLNWPASFPEDIKEFISKMVTLNPKERWSVDSLLKHPLLDGVDSKDGFLKSTLFPKKRPLMNSAKIIVRKSVTNKPVCASPHAISKMSKRVQRSSVFNRDTF
ncbi:Aurora kinase B [Tritrichomonas foetus]|uniref:Aurora kinase B n=1 Tax=Tritrichomonas foetus TaxID=1144522 RepID=A0A1J4KXT8_9EUKA|nr:Aurora kinase B [Tritrichomonas foetus]|eukprot:OHT14508.1 Aurora kinase B [Tritrichomonas foetus]